MKCRLCGSDRVTCLLDLGSHPIAHHFLADAREEEYVHSVRLESCAACGFVQMADPVPPEKLYTDYVCLSGWKNHPHAPGVLKLLASLPGITADSRIIEIGSNDGCFLKMLQDQGFHRSLGIEPARDACQAAHQKGVQTIEGYFHEQAARDMVAEYGPADLIVTRHVLEHIYDLQAFRAGLGTLLKPNGHVLIEVPNFSFILDRLDYSGIWEEHVNYWTAASMSRLLRAIDVTLFHQETATFSGEAIIVVGQRGRTTRNGFQDDLDVHLGRIQRFREEWPRFRDRLTSYLHDHRRKGGKAVLYGAGCRACSIVNYAGLGPYLEYIVDDQSEKQGKFMPGSRLPILSSKAGLGTDGVDLCLLAVNAENEERVIAKHGAFQGRGGQFASLLPPSSRLLPVW